MKSKMSQWKKKILSRKNGKGTVTEANNDNEVKATKIMEFIQASDIKEAKKGITVRFMHDLGQGTVYWLQGEVEERLTKFETAANISLQKISLGLAVSKLSTIGGKIQNLYLRQ